MGMSNLFMPRKADGDKKLMQKANFSEKKRIKNKSLKLNQCWLERRDKVLWERKCFYRKIELKF